MSARLRTCISLLLSGIFLNLVLFSFLGCGHKKQNAAIVKYRERRPFFGTMVEADVCVPAGQERVAQGAYKKIWQRLGEIHRRLNLYDAHSELSRFNKSSGRIVRISDDLGGLLGDAKAYSLFTKGTFDVTVAPLADLWKSSERKDIYPSSAQIQRARLLVGMDKIQMFSKNQATISRSQAKVDLGGIVAGYAADSAAAIFRKAGLENFYLDMGGEIYAQGNNCQGRKWKIGVQDPRDPKKFLDILYLKDQAVSTSGGYERFYTIKGKKFSHIINPLTGYPQSRVLSATVVAPRAEHADVFSTALCVLSPDQGIALVDALGEGFAAMIVVAGREGKIIRYESSRYKFFKR